MRVETDEGITGWGEMLKDDAKANFQTSVDAVKELLVACKGIDSSLG